jgi:hypothetical protein
MEHEDFQNFCWKDYRKTAEDPTLLQYSGCAPLNSLLTYFYPSKDSRGNIHYDGLGDQIINIDSAVRKAMGHQSFYYFVGDMFNRTLKKGSLLHSEVYFGVPLKGLCGFYGSMLQFNYLKISVSSPDTLCFRLHTSN